VRFRGFKFKHFKLRIVCLGGKRVIVVGLGWPFSPGTQPDFWQGGKQSSLIYLPRTTPNFSETQSDLGYFNVLVKKCDIKTFF